MCGLLLSLISFFIHSVVEKFGFHVIFSCSCVLFMIEKLLKCLCWRNHMAKLVVDNVNYVVLMCVFNASHKTYINAVMPVEEDFNVLTAENPFI
jgi:hypothetical protein